MATIASGTKMVNLANGHNMRTNREVEMDTVATGVYRYGVKLYTTKPAPTMRTLEKYCNEGIARTPCGCKVEVDGTCAHGVPAWTSVILAI